MDELKTTESPVASVQEGDAKPAAEKKQDGSFGDYFRVFHYADRLDWSLFTLAGICSIASGATLPLMTLIFGQFTTRFNNFSVGLTSPRQFRNDVDNFVLWFVYLFVARFAISYIANVAITIAAIRTTKSLRRSFLEATLRQHVWHFDEQSNGAAATQVTTNGNRINQGIAEKLGFTVQGLSLFFSSFIIALAVQWKLALITMSIIPVIFIVTGVCIAIDAKQEAQIIKIYSRAAVLAQEAISSARTVHAFWAKDKMVKAYDDYLGQAHRIGNMKSPNYGVLFSTEYFCVYAGVALSFWQGFRMFQSGEISDVGTVFTVVLSITIGATAISTIAPQIQSFTNAASAASELFTIIDKISLLDPLSDQGKRPSNCRGDIEVRDLDFVYPSRPTAQVLHKLNLSIPAGKTTALVGASGCGKSSLIALIERWYRPKSGSILLDGHPIEEYNIQWLRTKIRLVQQEPILFSGTIFQNVANGFVDDQRNLPAEEQRRLVEEACMAANAHDFIMEQPEGYDTQVGERASSLSGGQRQRISIARSIISDPKVLLLDEATSALDPRAERIVQDALNRVSKNRTTLTIAHRLSTIKSADNIVVMSYGQVMEQGTHDELIALDRSYAALVRAQDLGGEKEDVQDSELDKDAKIALERTMSLQRTATAARSQTGDIEEQISRGTMNYPLIKCIVIMLAEQKNLYLAFFVSSICCLVAAATFPAQALLYSRLIRVFTLPAQEARTQANFYALMFFVVALGNLVSYFVIGWILNIVAQVVTHRYRREMFQQVLNQDMDFFDRPENSSGALTSKLSSVPTALQELISANLLLILIVVVNVVSCSILGIAYGWKLGLVTVLGGLPVLLGSGYVRIRLDQKLERQTGERFADSAGLATEAVTSIRTVASLTLERQILREYDDLLSGIVTASIRSVAFNMIWYALSQSLEFLIMALG
jgi:ATP-binding cassette, subfamily B (MDR/TAP), member 1